MNNKMVKKISMIVACDLTGAIGKRGCLPWGMSLKADLERFKTLTQGAGKNAVVMGRKTWESIPKGFRPLRGRVNIVLSESVKVLDGAFVAKDISECFRLVDGGTIDTLWVIGGETLYRQFFDHCSECHLTKVNAVYPSCDAFFDMARLRGSFKLVGSEVCDEDTGHEFQTWVKTI